MNSFLQKARLVSNFLESLVMYSLDTASRGVFRTIVVFIFAPIVAFAVAYWLLDAITFGDNHPLPVGLKGFFYCLHYSIATFTGIESGNLACHCPWLWLTSLEGILSCIFVAVAIGYIVNRLSSR